MSQFIDYLISNGQVSLNPGEACNVDCNQSFFCNMEASRFDYQAKVCYRGDQIQIEGHSLNAVIWTEKCISLYRTQKSQDFISFDFSGCVMATFDIEDDHYGAHIQQGNYDCTQEWIDFVNKNPKMKNLVMFRPDTDKRCQEVRSVNENDDTQYAWLWGVITPQRECYSICVAGTFQGEPNYSLRFIEQHIVPFDFGGYDAILNPQGDAKSAWDNFWLTKIQSRLIYSANDRRIGDPHVARTRDNCMHC